MSKVLEQQEERRAAFKEAYASLNAAQKQAVDTIEGPVMVIAGPGTGKTQILTLRIANILLQTDTKPENILALTFTESGAKAMRERLRRYVGAVAYQIPIHTFHGFAGQLIAQYPDAFPEIIGGKPASDLDKIRLIESILDNPRFTSLRPAGNPQYYVTPILRTIATLKQEYLGPDQFKERISQQEEQLQSTEKIHEKGAHKGKVRGEYTKLEKVITKNYELLEVYRQYEALLRSEGLFDFDDMLLHAARSLQADESMLRDLQETYQYVLADEHQDVNGTQNQLLELLVSFHDQPNIFVVGDEKQAIYRFQGASLENFLYFEEKFPGTTIISLTDNYRSTQAILDVAHDLIKTDDERLRDLRVPLTAAEVTERCCVGKYAFPHQAVEDEWVVKAVVEQIDSGVEPEEIAVIVRTNREVEQYATLLRKAGLVVRPSADGDILSHPITTTVLELIEAVAEPANEAALARVLHHSGWGITRNDLVHLLSARSYDNTLASMIGDPEKLAACGLECPERVLQVAKTMRAAQKESEVAAPQRVVELLLNQSGLLEHCMIHDPHEGVRIIRRLYDEIESLVTTDEVTSLADVLQAVRTRQAYGLPLNAPFINTNPQAVSVMTAHKSKGLEFTCVFLPHLTDNLWGGATKRNLFTIPLTKKIDTDEFAAIDDERRLLYVGMTRAKMTLHVSFSTENHAGKPLEPSRLLSDIEAELLPEQATKEVVDAFVPIATLQTSVPASVIDTELLTALFVERGFSATSINNYLRSPWDYLYRNLLRIPEVQAPAMQYGTVIHNVLEEVTKRRSASGVLPSVSEIKGWLERELKKLPITTEEYTRLHQRGLAALTVYCEHFEKTAPAGTREELSISVLLPTGIPEIPEIRLTGKLDRIDLDESGQAIRVVDYKTGKPRTRNAIEGKTQSDDGGYKRQLVFYALLLSLYEDERYTTKEGVLSFVEADSKGVIKEESFTITDEEIASLKEEIITAAKEICSGSFLEVVCDPDQSSYCHLVAQLGKVE